MIILVDTREQLPYWQASEAARICLIAGDYTTASLLNKFHIERKSPQDLFATITRGNRRFKNELLRAQDRNIELVMFVECSKKVFIEKLWPRGNERKFPSSGLRRLIARFESKYLLEFVWSKDRELSKRKVYARLKKEERKQSRGAK